jgi:hypothetical protein
MKKEKTLLSSCTSNFQKTTICFLEEKQTNLADVLSSSRDKARRWFLASRITITRRPENTANSDSDTL